MKTLFIVWHNGGGLSQVEVTTGFGELTLLLGTPLDLGDRQGSFAP